MTYMSEAPGSKLLQDWIARAAARTPQKPWVIAAEDGRTVDYARLRDFTGRFAAWLTRRGIGPNDRVVLLADNSIEQLLCYFGVMAAGATVCTVHVEMNRNQLGGILDRLKPKLILYQDGLRLDDALTDAAAPRLAIGRHDAPDADTLFGELARCDAGRAGNRRFARRRRRDPVHLRDQRQTERRGSEFSRISLQHRSGRRRLWPYSRRSPL